MIVFFSLFFIPLIISLFIKNDKKKNIDNNFIKKENTTRNSSNTSSITSITNHSNSATIPTVIPDRISMPSPNLTLSIVDGKYRVFENHYIDGKEYTFGFPKDNCKDKRVWVGIGEEEVNRVSYIEAKRIIGRLSWENQNSLQNNNRNGNSNFTHNEYIDHSKYDDFGNDLPF